MLKFILLIIISGITISCKNSTEKVIKQDLPAAAEIKQPEPQKVATQVIPLWDRIEGYINTSSKESNKVLDEVETTFGRGRMHDVISLWQIVQFNLKNKLSKGVANLDNYNFEEQYDEQNKIAKANGF